jgi:hypothetical protein
VITVSLNALVVSVVSITIKIIHATVTHDIFNLV